MIPGKSTRKTVLATQQQWRTPRGSKRVWRQFLFYVRCHSFGLQRLMEVAERDSQKKKRGKGGRKKVHLLFRTFFV